MYQGDLLGNATHIITIKCISETYRDIINTWQILNYNRIIPNKKLIVEEVIYSNKLITSNNGELLSFAEWMQKEIACIKDMQRNNRFVTLN